MKDIELKAERAAFEAWWRGDLVDWKGHESVPARHAWEAWQARAAVEADRAQRVPERVTADMWRKLAESQAELLRVHASVESIEALLASTPARPAQQEKAEVISKFTDAVFDLAKDLAGIPPTQPAQQPKPSPIKAEHTKVYPSGTRVTRLELTDEAKESLRADVPHIPGRPVERKPMTDERETRVMKLMGVIDDLIEADPDRAERLIESILARNALRKRLASRHHGTRE